MNSYYSMNELNVALSELIKVKLLLITVIVSQPKGVVWSRGQTATPVFSPMSCVGNAVMSMGRDVRMLMGLPINPNDCSPDTKQIDQKPTTVPRITNR